MPGKRPRRNSTGATKWEEGTWVVCCKHAWGDGAKQLSDCLDQGLEWESQCAAGQRHKLKGVRTSKITYNRYLLGQFRDICGTVIVAFQHDDRISPLTSVYFTRDDKMNEKAPSLGFHFCDRILNAAQGPLSSCSSCLCLLSVWVLGKRYYFSLRMCLFRL